MEITDCITLAFSIVNVLAIIIIPIVAVVIGQKLQANAKKRDDKLHVFKVLMTSHIYDWTIDKVHALNIIDVVFADDLEVCAAWKDLHDKYCVSNLNATEMKKIQTSQYKLLETMAKSLRYDKLTWETIQNPYIPKGMMDQMQAQAQNQDYLNSILGIMASNAPMKKATEDPEKGNEKK